MLSKRIIALIFFIVSACFCKAASDSVHIDLNLVKFTSDFEKNQFLKLDKQDVFDPLSFLLCLDTTAAEEKTATLRLKLNHFFDLKLIPLKKGKTGDKLIKAVFKEIQDNLLSKYVFDAHFEKILDNGEYNCVTASALYALSFQKLDIPYQLRSTTDHVYVIANPGPNQLLIETTDPLGGAFSFNEPYKKAYIDMLLKQKLISKQEYSSSGIEMLFQKYFYTSDTIDFRQLIGYHYYNSGVEMMNADNNENACNQLMKGYYLNSKKQVGHVLSVALAIELNKGFDITDSAEVSLYFLFSRLYGETDYQHLYQSYVNTSDELVVRTDDIDKFQKMSARIFSFLTDTAQLTKFQEHYYYVCAYSAYQKKDFISAYFNIAYSYCLNNKNIRVKAMFDELQKNIFYLMDKDVIGLDSVLKQLDKASDICGRISSAKWKFQLMMIRASLQFNLDNEVEAANLLNNAEKFAVDNELKDLEDRYVSMGYGSAGTYYYKRYEIRKAKEYVLRGLMLDPGNQTLKYDLDRYNKLGDLKKPADAYNLKPKPPVVNNLPPSPRTVIVKTPH